MKKMSMRVVFVTIGKYPHIGGKSSHMCLLARGLGNAGVSVDVLSASQLSMAARCFVSDGPRVVLDAVAKGWGLAWCYSTRARLLRSRIAALRLNASDSVIHCHDAPAVYAVKSLGLPIVLTVHGDATNEYVSEGKVPPESGASRYLWHREVCAYTRADVIVTVDSRLKKHVLDSSGRVFGDVVVMPNFVDTHEYRPSVNEEERVEAKRFLLAAAIKALGTAADAGGGNHSEQTSLIFCPRRLVPKNGVDIAIQAVGLMRQAGHDIILVCGGDGPQRSELMALTRLLGLAGSVAFLGSVAHKDMPLLYRGSDVVVVPSISSAGVVEATSIAVIEAMSSGIPVVCSRVGGLTQLVEDGVDGLLFEPGDCIGLANAIESVLTCSCNGQPKALHLGAMGQMKVHSLYSYERAVPGLLEVYRRAIATRAKR